MNDDVEIININDLHKFADVIDDISHIDNISKKNIRINVDNGIMLAWIFEGSIDDFINTKQFFIKNYGNYPTYLELDAYNVCIDLFGAIQ